MNKYKLKWTRLQTEIFRFLCIKSGQKFNLREIAKELNVSPTAVSKSLVELEKDSLVKIERAKKINLFSIELNRDNQKTIFLKRTENLKIIYEIGLVDELFEKFPGCAIILFGSFSLGEDIENSDVDIAIIGSKEKEINLNKFEKLLEKEININFYKSWEIEKHLKNNILNGIVLSGGVEL